MSERTERPWALMRPHAGWADVFHIESETADSITGFYPDRETVGPPVNYSVRAVLARFETMEAARAAREGAVLEWRKHSPSLGALPGHLHSRRPRSLHPPSISMGVIPSSIHVHRAMCLACKFKPLASCNGLASDQTSSSGVGLILFPGMGRLALVVIRAMLPHPPAQAHPAMIQKAGNMAFAVMICAILPGITERAMRLIRILSSRIVARPAHATA